MCDDVEVDSREIFINNSFETKMFVITLLLILSSVVINPNIVNFLELKIMIWLRTIESAKKIEATATRGIEKAKAQGAKEKEAEFMKIRDEARQILDKTYQKFKGISHTNPNLKIPGLKEPGIESSSLVESEVASVSNKIETEGNIVKDIFDYQTHSSKQKSIVYIVIIATTLLFIVAGVFAFKMQQTKRKQDLFNSINQYCANCSTNKNPTMPSVYLNVSLN